MHYVFGVLLILAGVMVVRFADSLRNLWLDAARNEHIPGLSKARIELFGNPDTTYYIRLVGGGIGVMGVVLLLFGHG
jgi:hypothetical protein